MSFTIVNFKLRLLRWKLKGLRSIIFQTHLYLLNSKFGIMYLSTCGYASHINHLDPLKFQKIYKRGSGCFTQFTIYLCNFCRFDWVIEKLIIHIHIHIHPCCSTTLPIKCNWTVLRCKIIYFGYLSYSAVTSLFHKQPMVLFSVDLCFWC